MKLKFIFLILFISFCLSSFGSEKKLKVVATTADFASLAKEIGKDRISVVSLSKGTRDPHFIEVRPSMVVKLRSADLLILVGMELDIWAQSLIDASRNPKIQYGRSGYLDASLGIEKLEVPHTKVDGSMGHVHPYGNPHYWLDPENAKIVAASIADRLCELLPEERNYFQVNLKEFKEKIDERISSWSERISTLGDKKIVTYHRSWPYFVKRFELVDVCELEPKPGIPPSPRHLKEVIEKIKQEDVKVILIEVFYDEKSARFVSQQTGAKVVVVPNSVGGTKEAKDYCSLIDTIVNKLAGSLEQ